MNDPKSGPAPAAGNWDTYWHGAEKQGALATGGSGHPAIRAFWDTFFADVRRSVEKPRVVDIAGGNGAVVEYATAAFGTHPAEFLCVDLSLSAVKIVRQRYPNVDGLVADARAIPLESGAFSVATSQFGIEYAGLEAIPEMLRLVDTDGIIALLLHHRHGGIYRQSAASLDALDKLQESRFVPLSIKTFETGFAACAGGERQPYEAAAKSLVPAIRGVEAIMAQHGPNVADGTIRALYRDVGEIHGRLARYEPSEVLGWLNRMDDEIKAYAGRMSSMCDAAIDQQEFDGLCDLLREQAFVTRRANALISTDRDVPLAWAVIASRR